MLNFIYIRILIICVCFRIYGILFNSIYRKLYSDSFLNHTASFTVNRDVTAPSITINSPAAGWKNANFDINYDATDSESGASCQILTSTDGGASWTLRESGSSWCGTGKIKTITVGSGQWCNVEGTNKCTVDIRATDNVNNYNSQSRAFSIDYTKPATSSSNPTLSPTCTFSTSSSVPYDQAFTYYHGVYDTGTSGVSSCDLYVDGVNKGSIPLLANGCGAGNYQGSKSYTFPNPGGFGTTSHTVYPKCYDNAGNECAPGSGCHGGSTSLNVCGRALPTNFPLVNPANGCVLTISDLAVYNSVTNKPLKTDYTISCCPLTHDVKIDDAGSNDCDLNDFRFKNVYGNVGDSGIAIWPEVIDRGCNIFGCGDSMSYGYKLSSTNCKFLSYHKDNSPGLEDISGNYPPSGIGTNTVSSIIPETDSFEGHFFTVGDCLSNSDCTSPTPFCVVNRCSSINPNLLSPSTSPAGLSPENGGTTSRDPTLDVSPVVDDFGAYAKSYKFYVRNSGQTPTTALYQRCSTTDLDQLLVSDGLQLNTQYWWSAKACTDNDCNTCGS
ncbi:MAG: hypothetical protein HYS62_00275 [Candidatus Aenigmarchaeota archaeon]|nr:hypothetical protein [Candidatus Aenigmarchaeota archaeon]